MDKRVFGSLISGNGYRERAESARNWAQVRDQEIEAAQSQGSPSFWQSLVNTVKRAPSEMSLDIEEIQGRGQGQPMFGAYPEEESRQALYERMLKAARERLNPTPQDARAWKDMKNLGQYGEE